MKWTTSLTKMMMGIVKVDPKTNICHSTLVIEILMQHFFPDIEQQILLEVIPTRVHDFSTLRINALELKEKLHQTKSPQASSNRSPR
jgi:hypothetical protein